jgi:hypothetical protein
VQKDKHFCTIYRVCPKKRRVHFSLIYRRILIIYTPNEMVVNSLQKAVNSHIALRALRIRCQNILFQMRNSSLFDEFVCKFGLFWHAWAILYASETSVLKAHECQKRPNLHTNEVEYNVFLFDEPLKGSKSLKTFKISLTFCFDKL